MRFSVANKLAVWVFLLGTALAVGVLGWWYTLAAASGRAWAEAQLLAHAQALSGALGSEALTDEGADSAQRRLNAAVAGMIRAGAPITGAALLRHTPSTGPAQLWRSAAGISDGEHPFATLTGTSKDNRVLLPEPLLEKGEPFTHTPTSGSLKGYVVVAAPIAEFTSNQQVGWVVVQAHGSELASQWLGLFDDARLGMLAAAGGTLLIGLVAGRIVTARLPALVKGLQRVGAGDLTAPLDETGDDELSDIARAANQALNQLRERKDLRRSLSIARDVQRALLPDCPPKVAGLDIAAFCVYCEQTGGDYYDYLPLGPVEQPGRDGWAMVVGDVTGHGVPAALLMATARAILRANALTHESMQEFVGVVNRELCVQGQTGRFMTMFLLAVEPDMKGLRWVSAGHDAALIFDPLEQKFSELEGLDLPLGVDPDTRFTTCRRDGPLGRGQIVLIGTDGIWELRNAADKFFGKENLKRIIRKHANESADDIGKALLAALDSHRGDLPPQDDITFILLKVTG